MCCAQRLHTDSRVQYLNTASTVIDAIVVALDALVISIAYVPTYDICWRQRLGILRIHKISFHLRIDIQKSCLTVLLWSDCSDVKRVGEKKIYLMTDAGSEYSDAQLDQICVGLKNHNVELIVV